MDAMAIFGIVLGGGLVLIIIMAAISCVYEKYATFSAGIKKSVKVPLKTFISWYTICPQAWKCDDRCVVKQPDELYVRFSYPGYIGYHFWLRNQKKQAERKDNLLIKQELLKSVQKDIDKYNSENQ